MLAKHGLNSKIWIRAIGLSFFRDQKRREEKRKREKKRKRQRRRREEKKKGRAKRYGTLYRFVWILVRFGMDLWSFVWNYDYEYGF